MTIEANTPRDWGMRGATNTTLPQFKGKPRQLIVNVDDGYRPIIMDGSTTGGKFKCISVDEVSSKYLPLTGGTVTGTITLNPIIPKSKIETINGGDYKCVNYTTDGAMISLRSKSSTIQPGSFAIRSLNATSNAEYWLLGTGAGELQWRGDNIVRTVNGVSADINGNVLLSMGEENIKELGDTYILFKNNVLIQWRHHGYVTCAKYDTRYTYNFAKPFASIPAFFATPNPVARPTMIESWSNKAILQTSSENIFYYIFQPTTTGISYQANTSGTNIWLSFIAIGFAA